MEVPVSEGFEMEVGVAVNARSVSLEELSESSTLSGDSPPPPYSEVVQGRNIEEL